MWYIRFLVQFGTNFFYFSKSIFRQYSRSRVRLYKSRLVKTVSEIGRTKWECYLETEPRVTKRSRC